MYTVNTQSNPANAATSSNAADGSTATTSSILKSSLRPEKMDIQFDHLSVVSEECLSNSDDQIEQQKRMLAQVTSNDSLPPTPSNDGANFVPEKSAARLFADFQSSVPPLAHFENLSYKDIGPNVGKYHTFGGRCSLDLYLKRAWERGTNMCNSKAQIKIIIHFNLNVAKANAIAKSLYDLFHVLALLVPCTNSIFLSHPKYK